MRGVGGEQAAAGALWASFGTAGQRCTSCGNIIVHDKVYDDFKRRFLALVAAIRVGNPRRGKDLLYGPMICKKYFDGFMEHYRWGEAEGAKLLHGKGRIDRANPYPDFAGDPEAGYFCWPTVWENATFRSSSPCTRKTGDFHPANAPTDEERNAGLVVSWALP